MSQIIAMGGGGFSMEPDNLVLDEYVLRQTGKERPKVCFIPTASGDSEDYIGRFYSSFAQLPCVPSHLSLFRPPTEDLRAYVLDFDVLYVGGGNTKNLLALWRAWELDEILREAWQRGVVLAGISAGSLCWFEEGITDSFAGELREIPCLGFLPGSNCPHYDGEAHRRPSFHRLLAAGRIGAGWATDDGVALHYIDGQLEHIVSSRPNGKAYRVRNHDGQIIEETVHPEYLGH